MIIIFDIQGDLFLFLNLYFGDFIFGTEYIKQKSELLYFDKGAN